MKSKDYEKILYDMAQIIKDGIHIVSASGKSIVYNEAMSILEKTPREAVLGKQFTKAFSQIPKEESTLARALYENISTIDKRQTYLNSYGKEVTTINTTVPITNNSGDVIAAIEISKDITDIETLSNKILDMHKENIGAYKGENLKIKRYTFEDLIGKNSKFSEIIETAKM